MHGVTNRQRLLQRRNGGGNIGVGVGAGAVVAAVNISRLDFIRLTSFV